MISTTLFAKRLAFSVCLIALSAPALPQAASDPQLRADIDALKQGQDAMQRELREIKKLLQPRPTAPSPSQGVDATADIGGAPIKGSPDAKLTLIEFSDYQCPFCKRYHQSARPSLEKDYVETGKIRYVFRDMPLESLHPHAFNAAEAVHCAGDQGKFWEMHDQLFANQQALQPDNLVAYARALDLNIEAFRSCLDGGKYAEVVRKGISEGERLGVTGTPTFFIGVSDGSQVKQMKRIRGSQPYEVFKQEIDGLANHGGEGAKDAAKE